MTKKMQEHLDAMTKKAQEEGITSTIKDPARPRGSRRKRKYKDNNDIFIKLIKNA